MNTSAIVSASRLAARQWAHLFPAGVSAMDADDARQEAALAMLEAGKALPVVGFRRAINAVRRLTHLGNLVLVPLAEIDATDTAMQPWQMAHASQSLRRIDAMPTRDRDVIVSALFGEPSKDIAARQGITRGRVSQIVSRTVQDLTRD